MTSDDGITFRRVRPEDLPAVVELMRRVFGGRRADVDLWRHFYFETPWPPLPCVLAERGGELLSFSGALSRPLQAGDSVVIAGNGNNSMVAPEARGSALNRRQATEAWQWWLDEGCGFIFAFPNKASLRSVVGHGLPHVLAFEVPAFVRPVRPALLGPLLKSLPAPLRMAARLGAEGLARLPSPRDRDVTLTISAAPPAGCDALWERCRGQALFQTVRDGRYLGWRYAMRGGPSAYRFLEARRAGMLEGLMVLTEEDLEGVRCLLVVDWLVPMERRGVFRALLGRAVEEARSSEGVAAVALWGTPAWGRKALRAGFLPVPGRLSPYLMQFVIRIPEPGSALAAYPLERLRDRASWFLTLGDSDVV